MRGEEHEGGAIQGVFSSESGAVAWVEKTQRESTMPLKRVGKTEWKLSCDYIDIEECTVDDGERQGLITSFFDREDPDTASASGNTEKDSPDVVIVDEPKPTLTPPVVTPAFNVQVQHAAREFSCAACGMG